MRENPEWPQVAAPGFFIMAQGALLALHHELSELSYEKSLTL